MGEFLRDVVEVEFHLVIGFVIVLFQFLPVVGRLVLVHLRRMVNAGFSSGGRMITSVNSTELGCRAISITCALSFFTAKVRGR